MKAKAKKRGAVHETETISLDKTMGFVSDKLLPGGPMERLARDLAREYQRAEDPDYSCISWANQVKAQKYMESVDFDIVQIMDELERLNSDAFR
jgi:hypothetical protein